MLVLLLLFEGGGRPPPPRLLPLVGTSGMPSTESTRSPYHKPFGEAAMLFGISRITRWSSLLRLNPSAIDDEEEPLPPLAVASFPPSAVVVVEEAEEEATTSR